MSNISCRIGSICRIWVFCAIGVLLPITAAQAQVSIGNPGLRDSPFGSDVTDGRTAPYQVTYVAGEIRNQYSYAVSVPYSISIDGTTVYSGSKTVNGGTLTTVINSASPAPLLAAGVHTISMTSGATTVPRNFTVAAGGNSAPTDISLSTSSINENVAANSTVGTLSTTDPNAGDTFTYTLVSGTGSTDNGAFNISGSSLRITASPNYEVKNSYSVRLRTTDQGGLWYEEAFTITINNVNETPTDIALSASSINENVAANSTVGTLSSTDPDAGNTFTYTLVAGAGDTDNALLNISGSSLRITASPNFEAKNSYAVRVRTTDQGSLTYEEAFTITINNVNETPTDIALSASSINENVAANSTVGTLSSTDPDAGNTFTYTLVAGAGDTDNALLNISGSSLRITASPNFEAKNSFAVRVRTTDQGGLWYEEVFTITVSDVNEPVPTIEPLEIGAEGTAVLRWSSITNHLYTVHHSTNLLNGFTVRQGNIQGTPPMNSYTDTVNGVMINFWMLTTEE